MPMQMLGRLNANPSTKIRQSQPRSSAAEAPIQMPSKPRTNHNSNPMKIRSNPTWTRFRCDPDSHLDPNHMEFNAGRNLNLFGLDDFSPALKALALENMYESTPNHILEGPGPPAKQRSRWLAGKGSGPRSSRRSTASLQDLVYIYIYVFDLRECHQSILLVESFKNQLDK